MQLFPALGLFLLISGPIADAIEENNASSNLDGSHEVLYSKATENILRRNAEIASRLAEKPVQGVRKMSDDEGEKFFLDYWQFTDGSQGDFSERQVVDANATSLFPGSGQWDSQQDEGVDAENDLPTAIFLGRSFPFEPAFSLEGRSENSWRNLLGSRDFKCPTGTSACTSIGRSDRCCGTGDTCEIVQDTGSGTVGCCPSGQTCFGAVGSCQSGYTGCSQALGGGCCIPGYDCVPGGCEYKF